MRLNQVKKKTNERVTVRKTKCKRLNKKREIKLDIMRKKQQNKRKQIQIKCNKKKKM